MILRTLFRQNKMKDKSIYIPSGLFQSEQEVKTNCRIKLIPDENGVYLPCEVMYSKYPTFGSGGAELSDISKRQKHKAEWEKQLDEMYGISGNVVLTAPKESPLERSKRRAKKNMIDLIYCNHFDCFVTLTLDGKQIDRYNYKEVIKKLTAYLDNRVRRKGLKYVGVPELHKKGGFHFHFLCNSSALQLVHSGTYVRPCGGKPVMESTLKRQGFSVDECRSVFNIADWTLGFTTAIHTYGNVQAVANYVGKYITKSDEKIGGRWYYSGGDLKRPQYEYCNQNYNDVADFDFDFMCAGGEFKVKRMGAMTERGKLCDK